MPGRSARAARCCCSTTTWRSWRASPARMPGATALAQARAAGTFTAAHDAFWALARKHAGDAGGSRLLVEALLLHRHLAHRDVLAGLRAAVSVGSASPDVVAVEARKAARARGATATLPASLTAAERPAPPTMPRDRVVSLTERRLVRGPGPGRGWRRR